MGTQPGQVNDPGRRDRTGDPAYRDPAYAEPVPDPAVADPALADPALTSEPAGDPATSGAVDEQSPEEIRREIEQTRRRMSETVDDIEDRVSPGRVADRQKAKARSRWQSIKESVMGTVDDAKGSAQDAASSVRGSGSSSGGTTDRVREVPETVKQQARGNPLAAGLIAFGAGALAASMFPATQREQEAATKLADEYGETVKAEGKQVAQDVKDGVQSDAKDAAKQVASTAASAASNVKDEGASQAQDLREQRS